MKKIIISMLFVFVFIINVIPVIATDVYVTKDNFFASTTEQGLEVITRLFVDEDYVALEKFFSIGGGFIMRGGIKVHLVDMRAFKGTVKIRAIGTNIYIWTYKEAIQLLN